MAKAPIRDGRGFCFLSRIFLLTIVVFDLLANNYDCCIVCLVAFYQSGEIAGHWEAEMHNPEIQIKRKGSSEVHLIALEQGLNTFGREPGNAINLPSPFVSRVHGVIKRWSNLVSLKDNDSTNGIRVNGIPVRHKILFTGDVVEVGPFEIIVKQGSVE